MLEPAKVDLDATYTATIKPWDGGWEIAIDGPGITDGGTQACTLDEVKSMAQDYILTASDYPEDDDLWESACAAVKVELVLDLGAPHASSRSAVIEALRGGEKVVVVEEVTSWVEDPEAE